MNFSRRNFLGTATAGAVGLGLGVSSAAADHHESGNDSLYKISLAQWSFHKAHFGGEMTNLEFPQAAKDLGIGAVEFVNRFMFDKAENEKYLAELKSRLQDADVKALLIMIDREGDLGDPDDEQRDTAINRHKKWVVAAKELGCHSIRVNAASRGSFIEQVELAADGLGRLTEFADQHGINVIVENHGGLSSNGAWLSTVMEVVNHPRCGTLPDFGNFKISSDDEYDKYKGVAQLMPYAKAVSAKSYDFNAAGDETTIDYLRMMGLVTGWGYNGYVGIEYEGNRLGEKAGITATKKLLERVRAELHGHA
ncbi:sugar phosphate isomerase/epimerase family protein [Stratiformator vulcanicus]|uniref:Xylose isomerase-like TIM barrel n=1 Tax=Stratiformator vulcanicus TaxID=2527980 RepID=A0A517R406_9PLAN|nr:sugar phosphate isomerase/epimerase family protein [Stratiformator vulcanicus]QDT38587.1 Xylose isomerase-like TIM barrel [Stratiformator vulcanicus]